MTTQVTHYAFTIPGKLDLKRVPWQDTIKGALALIVREYPKRTTAKPVVAKLWNNQKSIGTVRLIDGRLWWYPVTSQPEELSVEETGVSTVLQETRERGDSTSGGVPGT